jgi:spermidine synthase
MSKSRNLFSIFVPCATVFLSSACIMVLELVAGRLIARYLGASLYTWTSVIGIVLAGITIGNYTGGRIADRFTARKTLALLLAISSVACVTTIILNNLIGRWIFLWQLWLPLRIFIHVCLVFLLPSAILGTVSPVVAKMALDTGLPTGRTVGDIYACGAAGSIVGTFLAGFYLIATMGTIAIIWAVGAVLLLMAILYWTMSKMLYSWATIFTVLMLMGMTPFGWAKTTGASLALREKPNADIIYEDESQYCYIAVQKMPDNPGKRLLFQDNFPYSIIDMGSITDLQFPYARIYAALTEQVSKTKNNLSTLSIGGGGYILPRYVKKIWPNSRVDVVEIDPGITHAAIEAFGLKTDSKINIITMDARNYVDQLLEKKRNSPPIPQYDIIYGDAFSSGYFVPYQLVTKEFNEKISALLANDGMYMINLIDVFDNPKFIAAVVNTLQQTFPNVYVISEKSTHDAGNFIVAASRQKFNLENLHKHPAVKSLDLWILSNSEIQQVKQKANGIILTDDYAPVENLLCPMAFKASEELLVMKYNKQAEDLLQKGKWQEAIEKYKKIIAFKPQLSVKAYSSIAGIFAQQQQWLQAIDAAKAAIEYNDTVTVKYSVSNLNYNIAVTYRMLGQNYKAREYLKIAIEGYKQDLIKEPFSTQTIIDFATALLAIDYNQAVQQLQKGINFMLENDRKDDAAQLQNYLNSIKSSKP